MASRAEKGTLVVVLAATGVLTGRYLYKKLGDHPADPTSPAPVLDPAFAKTVADAAAKVVRRTATTNGLRPGDSGDAGQVDRHRYFFLYRRALSKGIGDPTLRSGVGLQILQQRVVKDYDQVFDFLQPLVGDSSNRGPYFGGPDTGPDKVLHEGEARLLELGKYVKSRSFDPKPTTEAESVKATSPTAAQASTLRELDLRRMRVTGIVWRAAAVDADMWGGSGDTTTLQTGELAKILDRRLRTVERLRYEVSAGATDKGIGSSFVERVWSLSNKESTTGGPWLDDRLFRTFELPSLPRTARSDGGNWDADHFFLSTRSVTWELRIPFVVQSGTFVLEHDDGPTGPIGFDATALQVHDALRAIPHDEQVSIVCSGQLPRGIMSITIAGKMLAAPTLKVKSSNLSPSAQPTLKLTENTIDVEIDGDARFSLGDRTCHWYLNEMTGEFDWNVAPGTRIPGTSWALPVRSETQTPAYGWVMLPPHDRVNLVLGGTPTGGTFALEFDGESTVDIPHRASAGEVQNALAALATGGVVIRCEGGPLPDQNIRILLQNGVGAGPRLRAGDINLTGGVHAQVLLSLATGSEALPARIIHDLFASDSANRFDWWDRAWLHSDGMLAALHLEALRHALLRQPIAAGARPDDEFNGLTAKYSLALDDYFEVRTVSRMPDGIMRQGRTDYFENGATDVDDLLIGDQLLFATNPALIALGRGAWDPLTVLVTDVDTSPDEPRTNLTRLRLQGFGTADQTLASLQLLLVRQADQALKGVQAFIPAEIDRLRAHAIAIGEPFFAPEELSWDIGVITAKQKLENDAVALRLWSPYGDSWPPPGPWWIRFDLAAHLWEGAFGTDVNAIMSQFPGAIVWRGIDRVLFADVDVPWRPGGAAPVAMVGPGFREPPWHDTSPSPTASAHTTMFIPLFQPVGGWKSYFDLKAKSPGTAWPSPTLEPVAADARWVAGLARSSVVPTEVRVIRPRAKTHA